jgi:hypothetical protein
MHCRRHARWGDLADAFAELSLFVHQSLSLLTQGFATSVDAAVRLTWLPIADLWPQSAKAVLVSQQLSTGGEGRLPQGMGLVEVA